MKLILLKTFIALLILGACVSDELLKLASEYTGSIVFYEQAQKNLRLVYSRCEYKKECFQKEGMEHIKADFCPKFAEYKFVSETECHRAGQGIMDLVSGKTHIAVPVNNPTQNAHNKQMLEVEKQKLEELKAQGASEREIAQAELAAEERRAQIAQTELTLRESEERARASRERADLAQRQREEEARARRAQADLAQRQAEERARAQRARDVADAERERERRAQEELERRQREERARERRRCLDEINRCESQCGWRDPLLTPSQQMKRRISCGIQCNRNCDI